MQAAQHELSTFALVCGCAAGMGVPPVGALVVGLWGALFATWPDIDLANARPTKMICLFRYPVWGKGKVRWRSFPGYQLHLLAELASGWVFDRCATPADKRDRTRLWGPRYRTHRGLTHTVWFAALTGAGVWFVLGPVGDVAAHLFPTADLAPIFGTDDLRGLLAGAALVGTVGHILGDCCTDYGCAPLAPVWRWKGRRYVEMGLWRPMRFKVGEWVEDTVVTWLCWAVAAVAAAYAVGLLLPLAQGVGRVWTTIGA